MPPTSVSPCRLRERHRDALRLAGQPQQLLQPLDLHDFQRPPAVGLRRQPAVLSRSEEQVWVPGLGQQQPPDHTAVPPAGPAAFRALQPHPQQRSSYPNCVLTCQVVDEC